MAIEPAAFLKAARCPTSLIPQEFGLWRIQRRERPQQAFEGAVFDYVVGAPFQTVLYRLTEATMHTEGEVVMEDGLPELRRHLPIWLHARGRVLVTGLGLGCVVRGLLANPLVTHVDVIELDRAIIRAIGPEFQEEPRVRITQGDALECELPGEWDYAWHDIWCEGTGLQVLHTKLIHRYRRRVGAQGAWMLPRYVKRRCAWPLIG